MLATKEKSHPGFQLPTAALHPGFGFAISNTATEFDSSVYDFCGGPLSSGYFRDAETQLDYAKNRYHQPGMGRFLSPDPYMAAAGGGQDPSNPGSWNQYAYVQGDPVNFIDPRGLDKCPADFCVTGTGTPDPPSGGGGGGGGGSGGDPCTLAVGAGGPEADTTSGPCGGGGGGGGGGSATVQGLLETAIAQLKQALAATKCADDFKNVTNDLNKLNNIGLHSYGPLKYTLANGVYTPVSGFTGRYNYVTRSINLNSTVNWLDPSQQQAVVNGSNATVNLLYGEQLLVGASSLNAAQFMEITILHELAHYNGAIGNPDNPQVEKQLWNDCLNN